MTADVGVCCPRFEPEPWEGAEVTWENKRFVTDRRDKGARTLFGKMGD